MLSTLHLSFFVSLQVERLGHLVVGYATHIYVMRVADACIMEFHFDVRPILGRRHFSSSFCLFLAIG